MKRFTHLLLTLAIFGWPASAADGDLALRREARLKSALVEMDRLDSSLKLAIGDQLSFRIKEDREEKPRQLLVTDSGEIELPYIGRHRVVDKSCKEAALEIKKRLEENYYYCATVLISVDQYSRSKGAVVVAGAVRAAGEIPLPQGEVMTISRAILKAGGFADFADKDSVRLTRINAEGKREERIIDVREILEKGRIDKDVPLQKGDSIYVRQRPFNF
jgi:protein involved in polysaccharide export with SLBB domain